MIHKSNSGFSLLEFMIVIFIFSILTIIGVSSFYKIIKTKQNDYYLRSIKKFINQSRVIAVALNARLIIKPINNYDYSKHDYSKHDYSQGIALYNNKQQLSKIGAAPNNIKVYYYGFPSRSEMIIDATDGLWVSNGRFEIDIKNVFNNKIKKNILRVNKAGFAHF
jgi:prepilin-type N-terminal cleavage/methylation domain-containing protein